MAACNALFSLVMFVFKLKAVLCLRAPSYVSPWVTMDTNMARTLTQTFHHNFGVNPIKADVQVKSMTSGYIYPGVNTAQADDIYGVRAGVVCKYDLYSATLYAPNAIYSDIGAFLIYTGENYWTEAGREMATTAKVRVRLWRPDDFPTPSFTYTFTVTTWESDGNTWSISHGGSQLPDFTIVRGMATDGSIFEAVGSNTQPIWATQIQWGAVVYGVGEESVFIWAPIYGAGSLFSVCGGWGQQYEDQPCRYDVAMIEVFVWDSLGTTLVFQTELDILHGNTICQAHTPFNITTDLIYVGAKVAGETPYSGVMFSAIGAAMSSEGRGDAGLVYGYSNTGDTMRVWFSAHSEAAIVRIGPDTEETILMKNVVAAFKIWIGNGHIENTDRQIASTATIPSTESILTVHRDLRLTTHQGTPSIAYQGPTLTTHYGIISQTHQYRTFASYQGTTSLSHHWTGSTLHHGTTSTLHHGTTSTLRYRTTSPTHYGTITHQTQTSTLHQGTTPTTRIHPTATKTVHQGTTSTVIQWTTPTVLQGTTSTVIQGTTPTVLQGTTPTTRIHPTATKTVHQGTTPTVLQWTTPTVLQGTTSTVIQGTTPTVLQGTTPTVLQGTTPTILQGTIPTVIQGTTPTVLQGTTPTVLQGTISTTHTYSTTTSTLHQGTTSTVDRGITPTILQGTTPTVLQGTISTVLQGTTSTVIKGTTPTVLQGTTPTVLQGTTPTVPQRTLSTTHTYSTTTSTIHQGTTSTVDRGTTSTLHEEITPTTHMYLTATSTVHHGTTSTLHEGITPTTHIYPIATSTVHQGTTSIAHRGTTSTVHQGTTSTVLQGTASTIYQGPRPTTHQDHALTVYQGITSTVHQETTSLKTLHEPTLTTIAQIGQIESTTQNSTKNTTDYPIVCFPQVIIDITEAQTIGEEIARNLTVQAKTTAKYIRKLTSASDERASSKAMGMTGVVVCSSLALLIIISDLVNMFRFLIPK